MKDFSMNETERKGFVTKYRFAQDENGKKIILCKSATGDEYIFNCTKEEENKILNQMKKQTTNKELGRKLKAFENEYEFLEDKTMIITIINMLILVGALFLVGTNLTLLLAIAIIIIPVTIGLNRDALLKDTEEKIEDIDKILYFNENEELLNDDIRKKGIVSKVNKKIANKIINGNNKTPIFNINTIDDMSIVDLENLKESILKYKEEKNELELAKVYSIKKRNN
ncbi:MAG TPA: hypothetical protein PLV83_04790 [Bacilli bacterium]|nr:hypothetical protein [Bacilli bacterium]